MFEGDKFATCIKGRWNGKIPKCITTGCDYYDSIPNGEAVYLYNDALVQFICNPGYTLDGASALTCNGFGWNDTIPECKAPAKVEYSCDFESDSICGWSNGEHDEFDWTRNRGPTGSFGAGTGPRADHTLGTILGHYMYIGAAVPRTDGDRARLYSPVYPASFTDSPSCFAFYYHMYGNTTGDLHIYMKGETDDIEFMSPIYQMGGSDHENWVLHVIHLNEIDSNFQIVIEAIRGHSYMSDIAIDDVKLAHGEECDELHEEAMKQYRTIAPIITTTSPAPETTPEVEISSDSSTGTEATVVGMTSTTMSNHILLLNDSNTSTAEASTESVLSTTMETTEMSSEATEDYKSESTAVPEIMSSAATTEESGSTLEPTFDPGSEEDLSSCRNRCGEIAIDADTCGCDIECGHNHSCCLDVEKYCGLYLQTPTPIPPVTVAKSTSPVMSTTSDSTVETTPAVVTELSSSTLTVPLIVTTAVSTTPKITTTLKVSTTSEVPQTESPVESTSGSTVTTAVSTIETTQATTSKQVFAVITSTTTLEPTEETTTDTTTETTTTEATTTESTTTETTTTESTTEATTTETTTASTTETTTGVDKVPPPTILTTTQTFGPSTSPKMFTNEGISTTTVTEKQEVYATISTAPGIIGSSSTPFKGSNAATYAIVICTIIIFVIIGVVFAAYIRIRRRDKLPEDSDIQFLARDEIMMDGNIFNLSGTITQARNSAI
ncbi:uncharacterized protein [Palaemon carinicauda]|uniref:uncharacterized protein n=1 Tax=Palaemon carinicauda TaxID=392227 RepID=UPI0035B60F69